MISVDRVRVVALRGGDDCAWDMSLVHGVLDMRSIVTTYDHEQAWYLARGGVRLVRLTFDRTDGSAEIAAVRAVGDSPSEFDVVRSETRWKDSCSEVELGFLVKSAFDALDEQPV
ncbi:hypothetical protein [Lentzea sp. NBRC 102530]|uniref:hypothetical protein n=1 Tax=Lentzea sp. NBRC 102530 TaxID=3032201 RepID=UPI0024A1D539|nr:hypothetical protein [Lentzea sp. NBRC 102530]GLY53132.1 hypothetical protein Lesp01_67880 [Lentzea sp. NBRC 102530]